MESTVKAFFKIELKALSREYVSLFFMIVLPLILTVVFGGAFGAEATKYGETVLGIDTVVPVNIVFLLANAGLMGIPITISELKEQGVLKRYITYPVTYRSYCFALILTFSLVSIASTVLFATLSFVVYGASWYMSFAEFAAFAAVYALILFIFYGIGFLIALLIKSSRTANIVSSAIFMILLFTSGVVLPVDSLPSYVQAIAGAFPMYHSIEVVQLMWIGEFNFTDCGISLGYLVLAALVILAVLRRVKVRWD
jgi:ABC-2 type transport system permease protein